MMKMKRLLGLFLTVLLFGTLGMKTQAVENLQFDTPITMTVNDTLIKMDTQPLFVGGVSFVPIRFVSQALGADSVTWDSGTDSATVRYENTNFVLRKGDKTAYVNGKAVSLGSVGALINDDRLFVPVRFVSETLSCQVDWIAETYTVAIQKKGIKVPSELVGKRSYTDDEIYWLSKIIHAESQGEPMSGKVAVGNVILNRVKSRDYPNTIYGVIFDKKHGVQFSPILDGSIYQTPLGDSVVAAKLALEGENIVGNSLFFLNPLTAQSHWIMHNRVHYMTIRNHAFYL